MISRFSGEILAAAIGLVLAGCVQQPGGSGSSPAPVSRNTNFMVTACRSDERIDEIQCEVFLEVFVPSIQQECAKVAASGGCPRICLPPVAGSDLDTLRETFVRYADAHPEGFLSKWRRDLSIDTRH